MMYSYSSEQAGTSTGNKNKVVQMKRKVPVTNVLIIDDDEFFRDTLCDFLVEEGDISIIHRCGSYVEAKQWCSSGDNMKSVGAIILDVILPYDADEQREVDHQRIGLIILEKLRNQVGFTGPIIMLTNSDDAEDGKEALAKGCSAFLCKHASPDAIPRMVTELKLALSGDMLMVPNTLRHLIVAQRPQTFEPIHMRSGSSSGSGFAYGTDSGVTTAGGAGGSSIGNNPAWVEIKRELGYDKQPQDLKSTSARLQTRMVEWEMNGRDAGFFSSSSLVKQFMESAPRPILITTSDGTIKFTNRAAEGMFGCKRSSLEGMNMVHAIPSVKPGDIKAGAEMECYINNVTGSKIPVSVATSEFEDDGVRYLIHIFTDLTPQKTTEQRLKAQVSMLEQSSTRLEQLVKTDPLTGLLNRRGLEDVLSRELSLARRTQDDVVGIVIDLDDFKSINDGHGHAAGDAVLTTVAAVLKEAVRTSDYVGRVGGDEFIVFLPSTNLENGALIAERIRSAVASALIAKNGQVIRATTSLGVAIIPHDSDTLEQVLELTKSGLKSSKRRGKNTVSISAYQRPRTTDYTTAEHSPRGWMNDCVSFIKRLCGRTSA